MSYRGGKERNITAHKSKYHRCGAQLKKPDTQNPYGMIPLV